MEKDYFDRQLTCEEARDFTNKIENNKLNILQKEIEKVIKINENVISNINNINKGVEFFELYETKIDELNWVLNKIKGLNATNNN